MIHTIQHINTKTRFIGSGCCRFDMGGNYGRTKLPVRRVFLFQGGKDELYKNKG